MKFYNAMTSAITKQDEMLLYNAIMYLRALFLISVEGTQSNPKWKSLFCDCHSVARLLSIFMKECKLVDGFLLGLQKDEGKICLVDTCHSWLITPDGTILDPYPMGLISASTAILVPTDGSVFNAHGANLYLEDDRVRNHFDVTDSWRRARSHMRQLRSGAMEKVEVVSDYITKL